MSNVLQQLSDLDRANQDDPYALVNIANKCVKPQQLISKGVYSDTVTVVSAQSAASFGSQVEYLLPKVPQFMTSFDVFFNWSAILCSGSTPGNTATCITNPILATFDRIEIVLNGQVVQTIWGDMLNFQLDTMYSIEPYTGLAYQAGLGRTNTQKNTQQTASGGPQFTVSVISLFDSCTPLLSAIGDARIRITYNPNYANYFSYGSGDSAGTTTITFTQVMIKTTVASDYVASLWTKCIRERGLLLSFYDMRRMFINIPSGTTSYPNLRLNSFTGKPLALYFWTLPTSGTGAQITTPLQLLTFTIYDASGNIISGQGLNVPAKWNTYVQNARDYNYLGAALEDTNNTFAPTTNGFQWAVSDSDNALHDATVSGQFFGTSPSGPFTGNETISLVFASSVSANSQTAVHGFIYSQLVFDPNGAIKVVNA